MMKKSGLESGWYVGADTREMYKQNTQKKWICVNTL
jgi:hypothetical protein